LRGPGGLGALIAGALAIVTLIGVPALMVRRRRSTGRIAA